MNFVHPKIKASTVKAVVNQLIKSISIYDNSGIIYDFEKKWKNLHDSKYALLTNSGTTALHSLYYGVGIQKGDEVIVPAYTFFATVTPLFHLGAIPVLVDCDDTGNIDSEKVKKAITNKTKAIMVTHMWGRMADMDSLQKIANEHKLKLLEDASHAHGALLNGKMAGSFGYAAWSMQGPKTISGGEGGVICTNEPECYYKALVLGQYNKRCKNEIPKNNKLSKYSVTGVGLKYRSHPLAVAIMMDELNYLKKTLTKRKIIAKYFLDNLQGLKGLSLPFPKKGENPSWYAFVMQHDPGVAGFSTEKLINLLLNQGLIEVDKPGSTCPLNFLPLFQEPEGLFPDYKNIFKYNPGDFPVAEKFHKQAIKLPVWESLDDLETVKKYCDVFRKVYKKLLEEG